MSTDHVIFVAQKSVTADGSDPVLYRCVSCGGDEPVLIPATDADKHAVKPHHAPSIRVYGSEWAYETQMAYERATAGLRLSDA